MAELRFRSTAEQDLAAILAFSHGEFGIETARHYLADFDEVWAMIERYPKAGRVFRRGEPEIRTYPCRSHRVFYTIDGEILWIVRILHQAMDHDRIVRTGQDL
ncbi:MAG: type II toxin-antitoxin system RelE/ParE family toxin [Parasphingopyxis sp.]|nr:type II toxin-antitoxin system RelE/ParE family toxin [Sphingomonadales bacterium]